MGRVSNAIELKPYYERDPGDAIRAARSSRDDRALRDEFSAPEMSKDADTESPDSPHPALPRWQQRIEASEPVPVEPDLDDIRPAVAYDPPSQPALAPSSLENEPDESDNIEQRLRDFDPIEMRIQLEEALKEHRTKQYTRLVQQASHQSQREIATSAAADRP